VPRNGLNNRVTDSGSKQEADRMSASQVVLYSPVHTESGHRQNKKQT